MQEIKECGAPFAATYARIHSACFKKGWNEATMRQMLLMPGAFGMIAYEDSNPAGIIMYAFSPGQADIVALGVLPEYRGKKVSDALMDESFGLLRKKGVSEIFLEVAVDNGHAIGLYERHSFRTVGRRKNYYDRGDEKIDALVMRADL